MLQDILTCLGFILAIIAFFMSYFFARRSALLKNSLDHVTTLAERFKSETAVMSETSSVASQEAINLTRMLNELNSKLDSCLTKNNRLESELDEKATFMIQIQTTWEKERASFQQVIAAQEKGIRSLESHLLELEKTNASLVEAQNRHTASTLLLDRYHPGRNSEKLNMLTALAPGKVRAPNTQQKIDFQAMKVQLMSIFRNPQQNSGMPNNIVSPSVTKEVKEDLYRIYQSKLDNLKLIAKTLKGQKEMLEERNQNWEVALRYLSEYILGTRIKNSATMNIGALVGEALETLNKSLIMNELLDDKNDHNDGLNELSDLMQNEGSHLIDDLNSRH